MQTTTYPIHHGRTTEGTGRAKRPGHLFHLMTLTPPKAAAESLNAVRPEGLISEVEVIDGRTIDVAHLAADIDAAHEAYDAEQAETPIVGSVIHVLDLVADGVDTLGLLVEATGLGRTTVQGRLKALVADGRLRIAQPARGGKPARYAVI